MNIFFWILQILLALHTIMGAVWKFSNPAEKSIPSLKAIPQPVWISMSFIEFVLSLFLIAPAIDKSLNILVPISALVIAAEMIIYCLIHRSSGETNNSPVIYWSVVIVLCLFLAIGRLVFFPF